MQRLLFSSALLFVLLFLPLIGHGASSNSALAALRGLPPDYRNGVVWVSADNADPDPNKWYITARHASRGILMNLTVADGQIISERPTLSPRALLRQITPININALRVNSSDLWRKASDYARDQGQRLGSLSLQLQQHGRDAAPVWSVWSYDRRGRYIGFFTVLATNGAVISRN